MCEQARALFLWRTDAFVTAVTRSVTVSLWLCHLFLLQQIKAQGCRKSSLHSMLSSKLAGDVTQLKQKAQGKKNISGTGSRDKELSPCNSNPKHRSQGTGKAESRRESGGQSDTGRYRQSQHWLCLGCFVLIKTVLWFQFYIVESIKLNQQLLVYILTMIGVCKLSQQPVWRVAPKRVGLHLCAVDIKRDQPRWRRLLPVWVSQERRFSVARDRRQWRRERAHLRRVTPLIKVRQWLLIASYKT